MRYLEGRFLWQTLVVAGIALAPVLASAKGPKMKPEELVARHLAAIGPAEARAEVSSRLSRGQVQFRIRLGGAGSLAGPATYVSDGRRLSFELELGDHDYRGETFRYDGKEAYVATVQPGLRSMLGAFVHEYPLALREALLGGVLSTGWPLLDLEQRGPKLKYEGLRKFGGQEFLALRYKAREDHGDLKVRFYFDPESFRHRATSYELEIRGGMSFSPDSSGRVATKRYKLEEWFSEFKEVDGLTLPLKWVIKFSSEAPGGSAIADWELNLSQITSNAETDPSRFVLK